MRSNVEIKARVGRLDDVRTRAAEMAVQGPEVIPQEDTFFNCRSGRLKLRVFGPGSGEPIHYARPDNTGPSRSDYVVSPTSDPESLKDLLTRALGIRGVVAKIRTLYMVGRTRIHLDQVDDLGDFVELEVVLRPGETDEDGKGVAMDLMQRLGINETDLVDTAYIDLMNC